MTRTHRALLPFLVGGAAVVVLTAGIRASAGVLNPVLMAGFLALLLQPLTKRLRGVAGGARWGWWCWHW